MNMVKCYSHPHPTSRLQDYKITRLQDYKITRLQDYKITRLQDYKITRLHKFWKNIFKRNKNLTQVLYYLIIKDLNILYPLINKNEKAKASHTQYF